MDAYEIRDGGAIVATVDNGSTAIARAVAAADTAGHEVQVYRNGELMLLAWPGARTRWVGAPTPGVVELDAAEAAAHPRRKAALRAVAAKSSRAKAPR